MGLSPANLRSPPSSRAKQTTKTNNWRTRGDLKKRPRKLPTRNHNKYLRTEYNKYNTHKQTWIQITNNHTHIKFGRHRENIKQLDNVGTGTRFFTWAQQRDCASTRTHSEASIARGPEDCSRRGRGQQVPDYWHGRRRKRKKSSSRAPVSWPLRHRVFRVRVELVMAVAMTNQNVAGWCHLVMGIWNEDNTKVTHVRLPAPMMHHARPVQRLGY